MNQTVERSGPLGRMWMAGLFLATVPALAQQLIIKPVCGPKGTTVSMTGSGWPEPEPVCHYNFLFDGTSFAAQQGDGLYGPPNRSSPIPAAATVGDHIIKVELRQDSNNALLACRQDTFKVVTATQDPFNGGKNVVPGGAPAYGAGNIAITFDPTNSCSVPQCTAIRAIQAIQQTAKLQNGTTRNLTFTEQGFGPANVYSDASITAAGWTIDSGSGSQPYYSPTFAGNPGEQSATPKAAQLIDRPRRGAFPADANITDIILNFETNFFCDAGAGRGTWLGNATWTWSKSRASLATDSYGTVTASPGSVGAQPSAAFTAALALYDKNNNYTFPTIAPKQLPPGSGGQTCN